MFGLLTTKQIKYLIYFSVIYDDKCQRPIKNIGHMAQSVNFEMNNFNKN
jgi:hypothetical protein